MFVVFIHMNSLHELHVRSTVIYHIITTYIVYHYSSVVITFDTTCIDKLVSLLWLTEGFTVEASSSEHCSGF